MKPEADPNARQGVVQSVLGPVPAADLGYTMIHEHVIVNLLAYWVPDDDLTIAYGPVALERLSDIRANAFASRDNLYLDDVRTAVDELNRYKAVGGGTIVEVSSVGMGRDARALAWISEQTGVNVIAGCGYYIRPSHPLGLEKRSIEELTQDMVGDLANGIDQTRIKAGVIGEIGMASSPMDPVERRVLEAASRAQQMSGVAIITHSAPGAESPFEVAKILETSGADMSRVVISHLDERFRGEVELYKELAKSGVRLGFDTFGREIYFASRKRQHPTDDVRINTICALLEAGFGDRVVLAQDLALKHELTAFGGQGYCHILRNIVPRLRDRGVSQSEIEQMIITNPRQVLAGHGA